MRLSLSALQLRVGPRRFAALVLLLVASYFFVVHVFIASSDRPTHPRDLLSLRDDNSINNEVVAAATIAADNPPLPRVRPLRPNRPEVGVPAPIDDFDEALVAGDGDPAGEQRLRSPGALSKIRYVLSSIFLFTINALSE